MLSVGSRNHVASSNPCARVWNPYARKRTARDDNTEPHLRLPLSDTFFSHFLARSTSLVTYNGNVLFISLIKPFAFSRPAFPSSKALINGPTSFALKLRCISLR